MSFTGNGITNCYPDQVEDFISITVHTVNGDYSSTTTFGSKLTGEPKHRLPPAVRRKRLVPDRDPMLSEPSLKQAAELAQKVAPECRRGGNQSGIRREERIIGGNGPKRIESTVHNRFYSIR